MSKRILGFCGRQRSGKTTIVTYMCEKYNGKVVTIASYLKKLCAEAMCYSLDELNRLKNNNSTIGYIDTKLWKNKLSGKLDLSEEEEMCLNHDLECMTEKVHNVRELLQFVGTDIIRKYRPNWHIQCMIDEINSYPDDTLICIDDVRFPNERKAIEDLGGECFFIIRNNCENVTNHVSETSLLWDMFDSSHILLNDDDTEYFCKKFESAYNDNFTFLMENQLFLHGREDYLDWWWSDLFKESPDDIEGLIELAKKSRIFRDSGVIRVIAKDEEEGDMLCSRFLKRLNACIVFGRHFFLYNPLIMENMKRWL